MKKKPKAGSSKAKTQNTSQHGRNGGVFETCVIDSIPDNFKLSPDEEREFEASGPHAYDKAKWHYEGEYPKGLTKEQAFVHTGMFVGWLIDHDMITNEFLSVASAGRRFKRRQLTGAKVCEIWDGCLCSDQLTEEGNEFARFYYDGKFADDYRELLARDLASFYHVKDSWLNYGVIKSRIDERYADWKKKHVSKKRKRS